MEKTGSQTLKSAFGGIGIQLFAGNARFVLAVKLIVLYPVVRVKIGVHLECSYGIPEGAVVCVALPNPGPVKRRGGVRVQSTMSCALEAMGEEVQGGMVGRKGCFQRSREGPSHEEHA